jgi:hypothetical protein
MVGRGCLMGLRDIIRCLIGFWMNSVVNYVESQEVV